MRPPRENYRGGTFAGGTDRGMGVDPRPATADKNVVRGMAPKNPADNEIGLRKGGKVTKVMKPGKSKGKHK